MEGLIYVTALVIVGLISFYLGMVSWRKSEVHGARWLGVLLWSISLWTTMQAASALSGSMGDKLFYHNLMYIGISLIPLSVLFFVLDYYHLLNSLKPTVRGTMFAIPLLTIALVVTDSYHHLFYRSVRLQDVGQIALVQGTFNMWFWVHSTYSYLLILGTLLILGYQLANESGPYRRQSLQLIGAILASSIINLLTITRVINSQVDLTPFTFILVGAIFYYSLFRTRVFEIGPITKDLLYDNIHDALLILDNSGVITEHNRAFLNLFDSIPDSIIGRSASELFDDLGYSGAQVVETLNTGLRFTTSANHSPKSWQITRTPLKGRGSTVAGTLYLFKDVTEIDLSLVKADQALRTAETVRESITRNLSDMSHEIRTPLMGILGAAYQLKTDACNDEQAADANEILAGAEELLGTVNRVLDYSKLEAGKMHKVEEAFPLPGYLDDLQAFNAPRFLLEYMPHPGGELTVKGDRHHLLQLAQLIHSFLRDSGSASARLELAFDNGCLTHVLHCRPTSPSGQELLAAWEKIGEYLMRPWHPDPLLLILADKLAMHIGTRLTVAPSQHGWRLSYAPPLEIVAAAPPEAVRPDAAEQPYKLLFAEDSIINQAVIKRMLKALPWEIAFASNGLEALELARKNIYDGIFTDVHMPGLGGIELSYSLLETVNRDTPIFALTSDTDAELQKMIDQSPIRALLVKPCPKEQLIRLLTENPRIIHDDDD